MAVGTLHFFFPFIFMSVNKIFVKFDQTWPNFGFGLYITKTNILTRFQHAQAKNVASWVLTRFSLNLTLWPSFWLDMTQFRSWPRYHSDNILAKFQRAQAKNIASRALTSWPSFWTHMTKFWTCPRFDRG